MTTSITEENAKVAKPQSPQSTALLQHLTKERLGRVRDFKIRQSEKASYDKKKKMLRKADVNREMIDRLARVAKERHSRSPKRGSDIVDLTNDSSQECDTSPSHQRKLISRTTLPSYILRFIKDTTKAEERQGLIAKAESVLDLLKRKVRRVF